MDNSSSSSFGGTHEDVFLLDDTAQQHAYTTSKTLAVIRMVAGPISFIASLTIVVLILKSENRLKTTQNRLLTGLSISDMLASLAISIAHIAMPKDTDEASSTWMSMGNTATCDAYGFVFNFSISLAPMYNASLCIFFLLKIRYNVRNDIIKNKVEPFLHLVPIVMLITLCSYNLSQGYINPDVGMCFLNDYPAGCSENPDVSCERGEGVYGDWFIRFQFFNTFIAVPLVIIISMILVVTSVRQQEQRMSRFGRGSLATTALSPAAGTRTRQSREVKQVMYRALAYALVWLLAFIFPFIMFFQRLITDTNESSDLLRILTAIFTTLHGFWNFLVFIYPRIMQVQRLNPDFSFGQAFFVAVRVDYMNRLITTTSPTPRGTRRIRGVDNNNRGMRSLIVRSIAEIDTPGGCTPENNNNDAKHQLCHLTKTKNDVCGDDIIENVSPSELQYHENIDASPEFIDAEEDSTEKNNENEEG